MTLADATPPRARSGRGPWRRALPFLVAALVVGGNRTARAEEYPALEPSVEAPQETARDESSFSPRWHYHTFDFWDGAVTLSGAGLALTSTVLGPPQEPRWEGGVLFDDAVRSALRADSRSGRDRARAVGDAFYIGGALAPTLIDNLIVTLGVRRAPDVAAQMLLVNLEAYAVAGAFLIGSENVFARARPSMRPCDADDNYEAYCGNEDEKSSFISGHTGVVATSAGLICAHHQYLNLYGNDLADALACGIGIGAALTTGIARIINDRHYATDTLAAFGVGALSGYVLPVLRYYRSPQPAVSWSSGWLVLPDVTRTSAGIRFHHPL